MKVNRFSIGAERNPGESFSLMIYTTTIVITCKQHNVCCVFVM